MFALPQYTWSQDRELCKQCKHYREHQDNPRLHSGAVVMRCAVNPQRGRKGIGTCIDNRTRGPCGKEGRLFSPRVIPQSPTYHPKAPPTPPYFLCTAQRLSWERMPLVIITPLREPHVPFDTPGLEVAASPVDSFGSAPAQFLDWLTTPRFSSTQPRLGLLLSDGVRLRGVGQRKSR